jgi:hypothetical protein
MEGQGAYFKDAEELKHRVAEVKNGLDTTMREIALRKYSWDIVKQKYLSLFG